MSEKKVSTITRSERYVIDGKEYHSLSDIPESERKKLEAHFKLLEDKDKNGVPDIFQRNDSRTSYIETKEGRVSTGENTEKMENFLKSVLQDLGVGPLDAGKQGEEPKTSEVTKSSLINQHQDERRRERIRHYIVILALIAVIVFLLLRHF